MSGALLEKSQNSQREEDGEGEIYFPASQLKSPSFPASAEFLFSVLYLEVNLFLSDSLLNNKGTKPAMCSKLFAEVFWVTAKELHSCVTVKCLKQHISHLILKVPSELLVVQ